MKYISFKELRQREYWNNKSYGIKRNAKRLVLITIFIYALKTIFFLLWFYH